MNANLGRIFVVDFCLIFVKGFFRFCFYHPLVCGGGGGGGSGVVQD